MKTKRLVKAIEWIACVDGMEFLNEHKTVQKAWRKCDDVSYLLWLSFGVVCANADLKLAKKLKKWCSKHIGKGLGIMSDVKDVIDRDGEYFQLCLQVI